MHADAAEFFYTFAFMKNLILTLILCLTVCGVQAQSYDDYVRRGLSAAAADSLAEAEHLFREAMRLEPAQRSNAMLHYYIGQIQEKRQETDLALESYTMGLNIAPHLVPLRMGRAALYMQLNRKEMALLDYSDILDWKPDYTDALFMRAYIYSEQKLYKKARTDYEALLKIEPSNEKAQIGLVLVNDKDNRPREAMEQINAMIATSPDHAILYAVRAGMEHGRKLYELAEIDFQKAVTLDPENPDFLICRAMLYIDIKENKKARADLEKALQLGGDAQTVASLMHQIR